ncbi:MAG: hypothetical protein HQK89_15925 [Nitrospirae bacterium]|nr:hypothetical protein [Nitrospirota bacterium]
MSFTVATTLPTPTPTPITNPTPAPGAVFIPAGNVPVASQPIPAAGGTISVGHTGTPIDGVSVTLPGGALSASTNVTLGYNTGNLIPIYGTYAGVALTLNAGNVTQFNQPVSITVPFTDTSMTPVPFYIDDTGQIHLMQLVNVDRTARTFTLYYSGLVRDQRRMLSDQDRYNSIYGALKNTGNPVLIYLAHSNRNGAHSVLAYDINSLTSPYVISIYNPNNPGQVKQITYNPPSLFNLGVGNFYAYAGYDVITYNGDGSLRLTENYLSILTDADNHFNSSANAVITVRSHTNGQTVTDRNVTLTGNITSGQVLVTRLKVLVGSTEFITNVDNSGNFSIAINLENGVNHLTFVTQGNSETPGEIYVNLPNNMMTTDFTLNLNSTAAVMLVTVTWNTNDTDVDTYVIDPTGDYSSYYHLVTADGGRLDHDVTTGYGPEHWTLTYANTIRYNQPSYKVRLHYYSDHGHGGTNYTVSIKLYEGTSREQTSGFSGYLPVSSPGNNQPNGSGADWADIASITLVPTPAGAI